MWWNCFSINRSQNVANSNLSAPPLRLPYEGIQLFSVSTENDILERLKSNIVPSGSDQIKSAIFSEIKELLTKNAPQFNDQRSINDVLKFTESLASRVSEAYGKKITGLRFDLRKMVLSDAFNRSMNKRSFCNALLATENFSGKNSICREMALVLFDEQKAKFSAVDFKGKTKQSFALRNLDVLRSLLQLSNTITKQELQTLRHAYPDNKLIQKANHHDLLRKELIEQLLVNYPATGKRAHRTHPAAQVLHDLIGASCHPVKQDNIDQLINKNIPVSIPNINHTLMLAIFDHYAKGNLKDFLIHMASTPNPCYEGIVENFQDYQTPDERNRLTTPPCPKWEPGLTTQENLAVRMEYVERSELINFIQFKGLKLTNNDQKKIFEITTSEAFGKHLVNRKDELIRKLMQKSSTVEKSEVEQWLVAYLKEEFNA